MKGVGWGGGGMHTHDEGRESQIKLSQCVSLSVPLVAKAQRALESCHNLSDPSRLPSFSSLGAAVAPPAPPRPAVHPFLGFLASWPTLPSSRHGFWPHNYLGPSRMLARRTDVDIDPRPALTRTSFIGSNQTSYLWNQDAESR